MRFDDFSAMPSHAVFLCVIYPVLGLLMIAMTLGYSMPLAFPLAAGFALLGPLAAIGSNRTTPMTDTSLFYRIGREHTIAVSV